MRSRYTQRDVAALARVDPSVISRVINDDPSLSISAATRRRVLATIEELGYRPNITARGLRLARSFTIGFIVPDITNPGYIPLITSVQRRAEERGYVVIIGGVEGEARSVDAFVAGLSQGRVDGLLVASARVSNDVIRQLIANDPRIVLINRRVGGVESYVAVDDEGASRMAVEHLTGLGHRQIAHIAGVRGVDTAERRRDAFVRAALDVGASCAVEAIDAWTARGGYEAAYRLFERETRVTGVYIVNGLVALGVLKALRDLRIEVPGQVSVVTYHDSVLAEFASPPLTAIRMPFADAGRSAVDLLIDLIDGKEGRPVLIQGEPILIQRDSSGPPPA